MTSGKEEMTQSEQACSALPDDFAGWWGAPGEWVEEPNQRRSGWSGMLRVRIGEQVFYVKKQCNHLCRTLAHPFGWPTASRERLNIGRLQALGLRVPTPVFHGERRSENGFEAILVTEELAGFAALDTQTGLSPAARQALAAEAGRVLGIMHRAHWQHSCLYDKHLFVRWQGERPEVALIDLEKLRRPILHWKAAAHDLNQLQRHQKIWSAEEWRMLEAAHRNSVGGG
jgi:hypothetical protein